MSHWGAFTPTVDDRGEVTAVRPSDLDPAPSPLLGNLVGSLRHGLRIPRPMVRSGWLERGPGPDPRRGDEPFVPVGWDEVLDRLSTELARVYRSRGPEGVFGGSYGWSSAGRFHHAQGQVHRFLNSLGGYVGSVNTYSAGTSEVLLPHVLGGGTEILRSLTSWPLVAAHTELLVCFGGVPAKNTAVAPGGVTRHSTEGHLRVMAARGAEFVLVGPDRRDLPEHLDARWLPARPGTDTALMLALCHVLVTEGRYAAHFVERYCTGLDRVLPYLTGESDGVPKSPHWAAAICGIDAETITSLARAMASRTTLVTVTFSLQRAEFGEQPVWAGVLLAALIGQIGLPGGGFGHGYGSVGDIGYPAHAIPLPTLPQGTNPVREHIPVARIADMLLDPGGAYDYDGERRRYPDIELVYWCGGNPFHHHQDLARLREAWRRVATVVVHEPYWTPAARHADIVVPATVTLERDDIGASRTDPFLTAMRGCAAPYEQARDDYATFAALAEILGVEKDYTEGRTAEQWLRHLYDGWRDGLPDRRLPDFDAFWAAGRVDVGAPPPNVLLEAFRRDPVGNPLATPSGRIELYSEVVASYRYADCPGHPTWLEPEEWHGSARAARFPLVLLANNPAARLHSQLDFGPHSRLSKVAGREPVRMHPRDAERRHLADGDLVRVFNDRGACIGGVVVDPDIAEGVVQMSTGAWLSPVAGVDPILCSAGNVNVLTRDSGSSRLSQGCSGSRALVEIEGWPSEPPAVAAAEPPATVVRVSKRTRRRKARRPATKGPARRTPPRRPGAEEPDLVREVAAALDDHHPLALLELVSAILAALDPRRRGPFEPAPGPDVPSRDELVQTFLDVDLPETSALLAVVAEFADDEVLRRRVLREITARAPALPRWLADLRRAEPAKRVVELVHVLGDGDNLMVGVRLPDGQEFTAVVYVDHNVGTLVKDAFVVPEAVDALVERMLSVADDPDTEARDLDPADARTRITEAIKFGAISYPPFESDTWPACRPLVEWVTGMLPAGGAGYQRPDWDAEAEAALTERFLRSRFGRGFDDADHRGLLESLLWFGTDYGPGDPLRWSPVAVEILLADWIPRKIVAEAPYLAKAPSLLRAFIAFCHDERGIRPELTAQTLGAVDQYEPQYQRVILAPRPQGPAALLAAMGALNPQGPWSDVLTEFPEVMLDSLRGAVGGADALDRLDAKPLPDEPFAWGAIPADVHDRVREVLELVDRWCDGLGDPEYRTACRRFLAGAAAGDPEIFRRRGKAATAAAAVCWVIGKANSLFTVGGMLVKDLASDFGVATNGASQRSRPLLRAIGVDPDQHGEMNLGSPDYLTSTRRERIAAMRDQYR